MALEKRMIQQLITFVFTFISLSLPVLAADDYGLSETGANLPQSTDLPSLIGKVLGSVLGFTGTIFFILVVYAGLMWMTAGGNEDRIKKARQILIAAIIGLVIVLSAYAITQFIGGALGA